MTALAADLADERAPQAGQGVAATGALRLFWLGLAVGGLALAVLASIAVGARNIPLGTVVEALFTSADGNEHAIVRTLRLPRTLLGLLVGVSLGTAGALIQALTRNPLADPGLLGVNAGAAFAVVVGVGVFGLASLSGYIWFAFLGAVAATLVVYAVGSIGRAGATPVRLTLAGVAVAAVLSGITQGVALIDPATFDRLRHWMAGSIANASVETAVTIAPFIGAGLLLALLASRPLNAVALGEDMAAALGASVLRTRAMVVLSVTLLSGAATAAAGPIAFVGLMVPHVARWIVGPDQRWILAFTVVLAPILLLVADVAGRIVMRPGELQVGIVTAFVGAPVLIYLARRRRVSGL